MPNNQKNSSKTFLFDKTYQISVINKKFISYKHVKIKQGTLIFMTFEEIQFFLRKKFEQD